MSDGGGIKSITITSAGSGAVGIGLGLAGGNTDAAFKVLDAVLVTISAVNANLLLASMFVAAALFGCWRRTGDLSERIVDQYRAQLAMNEKIAEHNGLLIRVLDRSGIDTRKQQKPVSVDRRRRRGASDANV